MITSLKKREPDVLLFVGLLSVCCPLFLFTLPPGAIGRLSSVIEALLGHLSYCRTFHSFLPSKF